MAEVSKTGDAVGRGIVVPSAPGFPGSWGEGRKIQATACVPKKTVSLEGFTPRIGSKMGPKTTRTPCYMDTKDTGKARRCNTIDYLRKSAEVCRFRAQETEMDPSAGERWRLCFGGIAASTTFRACVWLCHPKEHSYHHFLHYERRTREEI